MSVDGTEGSDSTSDGLLGPAAQTDLRLAPLNLCIAQRLRNLVPGSASGEALLWPDYEQRQMLEIIRERAQIAMMQYALLGVVFSPTLNPPPNMIGATSDAVALNKWAQAWANNPGENANQETLSDLGRDFAAAVQLHVTVTQELASLLSRSRSAHTSRGNTPANPADDLWGSGSWYQRSMALMFGGDPLAIGANLAWPQAADVSEPGTFTMTDWPTSTTNGASNARVPEAKTPVTSPTVYELLALARQFDKLDLITVQDGNGCTAIDIPTSASQLYDQVEQQVRIEQCLGNAGCTQTGPVGPPYVLESNFNITLDTATTLVSLLADEAFTPSCLVPGGISFGHPAPKIAPHNPLAGAMDLVGDDPKGLVTPSSCKLACRPSLHISPSAMPVARTLAEVASPYTALAPLRFPEVSDVIAGPTDDARAFALSGWCYAGDPDPSCSGNNAAEAKRTMGAVSALAATRDMILSARQHLDLDGDSQGLAGTFYATSDKILDVIAGAIGSDGVSVVPIMTPDGSSVYSSGGGELGNPYWIVHVTHAVDDPFWSAGGTYAVVAIQGAYAGNLAAHPDPGMILQGQTLQKLVAGAPTALGYTESDDRDRETRTMFIGIPLAPAILFDFRQDPYYTFVVEHTTPSASGGGGGSTEYRLLVADLDPSRADPRNGHYVATGGTLGDWMRRQTATNDYDPSTPAYDGFDLRNPSVPPFSAQLVGGTPNQTMADYYLSLASAAAKEATTATNTAFQTLLTETQDTATEQAAVQQEQQSMTAAAEGLCGADNQSCDTSFQSFGQDPQHLLTGAMFSGFPSVTDCTSDLTPPFGKTDPNYASCVLDHDIYQLEQAFLHSQVDIATPVLQSLKSQGQPSFEGYAGGSLQSAFITQWADLHKAVADLTTLTKQRDSALSAIQVAEDGVYQANQDVQSACEITELASIASCTVAATAAVVATSGGATGLAGPALGACVGAVGGLLNDIGGCNSKRAALTTAQDKEVNAVNDALSAFASQVTKVIGDDEQVALSGADIRKLTQKAALAQAQAKLQAQITTEKLTTSFGLYLRYHDYDLYRAMALMENARIMALTARRAIESRYVVDLSSLTGQEAFVASPASWADEVYKYDLSLPASVGLSVDVGTGGGSSGGTGGQPGIYTNAVTDYVGNLQDFVSGYAVNRPSAVATADIDIVSLPGLAPGQATTVPGAGAVFLDIGKWMLHCPGDGMTVQPTWIPAPTSTGDSDTACQSLGGPAHPDQARLLFLLDPWGRLNGAPSQAPSVLRYNARWDKLAVNIVGTGVKDCALAADPQGCQNSAYVPYDLTQVGPSWVTDYDENWRYLDTPIGQIEQGKALANGVWLDPVLDVWTQAPVEPIARTEYAQRPLGGAYSLVFAVAPEVQLDSIERVQLLVGSDAWVAQQ